MADYAADISINDYLFREEITITETGGEDRTNFPVKLSLTSSNFNFALAKSNGHDIRIAEASNGTRVLNTWVASWSNDAEAGTVWLKIPNLLSGEDKTLYVYWGNRNAFDSSNVEEIGFLFADGFDSLSLDQTKWLSSGGISAYLDSMVVIDTDGYIESKGLPLSGVVNWIVEEGVYVYDPQSSTTVACHRYRFYGTENNFGFDFFREGSSDRSHNVLDSSTWIYYNGTDKGFDASGYSENYIGYKEPTDRVYQGMSSRPTLSDYDDSWERQVYGDTRITYFRIYGRDTAAVHQISLDWIIVREYFVVDPYTVDTSSLYVPYETVHHETIDLTPYDDDVTTVDFFHTTSSGGDPYKLSDNISSAVSNCWYSDDYTGTYIYEWVLDSKYKLLLHMEDVGLSDSSSSGHVVTVSGVARSSTRYNFGDYAAYWDGTLTYYMAASASLDWNLGTGDFTIHWWVNYVSYAHANPTYLFYWNGDNLMRIADTGAMYLELGGTGQTSTEKLNQNDVWFHIAVVRSGGTVKVYKDGKATSISFSVGSLDLSNSPFYIGSAGGSDAMYGYIDEFEIVKGEALWIENFPLPEAPSEPVFINTIPGIESVIDFGRGSEDYNLVSTEYIHYDDGHTGYYNASKLSNSNDDEYFQGTTTSGYVCIDWADDNIELGCLSVKARSDSLTGMIKNFIFLGGYKDPRFSTDSDWTTLCSGIFQQELIHQPVYFVNENPYRYYKLDIIDTYGSTPVLQEWKMYKYEPLYRPMTISQLRLNPAAFDSQEIYFPKQIELQASDNMIDWTTVLPATSTATPFYDYTWNRWQRFSFENIIGYYNYKLICYGNWNDHSGPVAIAEWEMVEKSSEAYTHRVLAGTLNNFSSIWASPTTTFDGGFVYIGDGEILNTVYDDSLVGFTTVVSGVLDINLI